MPRAAHWHARLALVVGAVGATLVLIGWGMLLSERRAQTLEACEITAGDSRRAIATQMRASTGALENLAHFWGSFGRQPEDEWHSDSSMLIQHFPGIRWIAWVDERGDLFRVAARGDVEPPGTSPGAAPSDLEDRHIAPLAGAENHGRLRAWLPIRGPSTEERGLLVAEIDVAELLAPVLGDSAAGYAVSVQWNGTLIHQHRVAASHAPAWWTASGGIRISDGVLWRVTHRPLEALVDHTLTPLPNILLLGGLVLSGLLAVVVQQFRSTRASALQITEINRLLDDRIEKVSQRDADLVRLNHALETRVEERSAKLREAIEDLETLNYSVSHDLRSPLGAILNFAAMLDEDYGDQLDAPGHEMLKGIRSSAESGLQLLEGLLELSRAGRAPIHNEPIPMGQLARNAFSEIRSAEPQREIDFEVKDLPDATADVALIGDVFANLFSNALKYTRHREKAHIRVEGHCEEDETIYSVVDDGIGFDQRFSCKLFGVFERLHSNEEGEGTGVGLAIVARIVHRHGGRTWAEGRLDKGATFYFSLPRDPTEGAGT